MNVEVTTLPESQVALKIELTPDEVEGVLDRTHQRLAQRINVAGFRKGKAPRAVLERAVGQETFLHEATEDAIRWGYRKALEQANVAPIDEADIKPSSDGHDHLEPGEAFGFEATVSVRPEVQLPDYRTIHLERPEIEVSETDVDELLRELREAHATLEPVARPAQIGDVVTLNITGRTDGEEVINNDNADYELRDEETGEADPALPGLSRELVGITPGDIREVTLHLPETETNEGLAGKTVFLRILPKEIKRKILPEVSDEFASSVSELRTVGELREALRSNIVMQRRIEAEERLAGQAIEELKSRTFVDIPSVLVEEEVDHLMDEMHRTFEARGLNLQTYLDATGKPEEDIRRDMREGAADNVKMSLVLGALAEAENIQVSPAEIDAALEEILRSSRSNEAERRRLRSSQTVRQNVGNRVRRQRAVQRLVEIVAGADVQAEAEIEPREPRSEDIQETVAAEAAP